MYMEFSGLKKVQFDVYGIPYTSFATVTFISFFNRKSNTDPYYVKTVRRFAAKLIN